MGLLDILNSLGVALRIIRNGPINVEPGTPVVFNLDPPDLVGLTVPVIMNGDLSLTWLTKNVRFQDQLLAPATENQTLADALQSYLSDTANVIGGVPIVDIQIPLEGPPLQGAIPPTTNVAIGISTIAGAIVPPVQHANPDPVANQTTALQPLPTVVPTASNANDLLSGIPGLLGQLAGSIPIPGLAPVSIQIKWHVERRTQIEDLNGGIILEVTELQEGVDFLAPNGMNVPQIELIFSADPVELTAETKLSDPKLGPLYIHAEVTLSAGGVSTPPITLPLVKVMVPLIGIPRIAAFFRHPNFQAVEGNNAGFVFVMVPGNSPFRALNELSPVITHLQTTLGALTAIGRFASFLLGINQLVAALNASAARSVPR